MAAQDEKLILVFPTADEYGFKETYGYENALILRRGTKEVHLIVGDSTPSGVTTYDNAPVGSLFFNTGGGEDTTFFGKTTTAAAGWSPFNLDTAA